MIAFVLLLPLIIVGLALLAVCAFLFGFRKSALALIVVAVALNLFGEAFPLRVSGLIKPAHDSGTDITVCNR